jgi:hypothetical protein
MEALCDARTLNVNMGMKTRLATGILGLSVEVTHDK